jgi:hypothetical protein
MADPSYMCHQLVRSEPLLEGQELVWGSKRFCRDVATELRAFKMDFLLSLSDFRVGGYYLMSERSNRLTTAPRLR